MRLAYILCGQAASQEEYLWPQPPPELNKEEHANRFIQEAAAGKSVLLSNQQGVVHSLGQGRTFLTTHAGCASMASPSTQAALRCCTCAGSRRR